MLTAKLDMTAAKRFFDKAMQTNGDPEKVAMDKSGANKTAIDSINAGCDVPIVVRQVNTSATLSSKTTVPSSG